MSQKSSVPQAISFVSQVLKRDSQNLGHAREFRMQRANMQPGSAEWHAGFDHPGAELVEKFAIASDKAALLRQPFRKASRSIR